MQEVRGNLWDFYNLGNWVVITTNGVVKTNGRAVMGRGIALEAKQKVLDLDVVPGRCLSVFGNQVFVLADMLPNHEKIVTFPTKHDWRGMSSTLLIERSAAQLEVVTPRGLTIYMVRPGCSNGGLSWTVVRPMLEKYLDSRFVVVHP